MYRRNCHLNLSFSFAVRCILVVLSVSKKRRRFSVGSHFSSYSTPLADKRHERSEKWKKKWAMWKMVRAAPTVTLQAHRRIRKSRSFLSTKRKRKMQTQKHRPKHRPVHHSNWRFTIGENIVNCSQFTVEFFVSFCANFSCGFFF